MRGHPRYSSSVSEREAQVRAWLTKQGYPLEYAVARAFAAEGFAVTQGTHYDDGNGVYREVDVVAELRSEALGRPEYQVPVFRVVIECKTVRASWVALTTTAPRPKWAPIVNSAMEGLLRLHPRAAGVFLIPDHWAFSAVQAEDKGRDLAYDGVQQAVSAAVGVLGGHQGASPDLSWPVVVLSEGLFGLDYDEEGREHLAEIDRARLLWSGQRSGPAIVDVVTHKHLQAYLPDIKRSLGDFLEAITDQDDPEA